MRQARLLLLAVLPLLAIAAWWLSRDTAVEAPPGVGTRAIDPTGEPGPTGTLRGSANDPGRAAVTTPDNPGRSAAIASGSGQLVGRVMDPEGRPVVGAVVRCTVRRSFTPDQLATLEGAEDLAKAWRDLRDQDQSTEVAIGMDGAFALPVPAAAGDLRLEAAAHGYVSLSQRAPRPADDDVAVGDLILTRGAVLSGRVVDRGGQPIAGARVRRTEARAGAVFGELSLLAGLASGRGGTITEDDGRFALTSVPPGPFTLQAAHRDYPTARLEGRSAAAGEKLEDLLIVMERGASISGRVSGVPKGTGALRVLARRKKNEAEKASAGVFMRVVGGDLLMSEHSTDVADDGSFELAGLRADQSYEVWASQTGRGLLQINPCTERIELPAGTSGAELRFEEGVTVTATVVDATSDQPLTELRVRPSLSGGGSLLEQLGTRIGGDKTQSYPGGRVTVANLRPKRRQTLTLRVTALGYGDFERKDIDLPTRGRIDLGVLRLEPAPVVRVRVIDAASRQPVAAARVTLRAVASSESHEHEGGSMSIQFSTSFSSGDADGPPAAYSFDPDSRRRTAQTDAEGRCVLNSLPGATARLEVHSRDYAAFTSDPTPLPSHDDFEFEAELLTGGTIDVTVTDHLGQPIRNATVDHRAPGAIRSRERTDARGVAQFERLAPGEHEFRLRRQRKSPVRTAVMVSTATPKDEGWEKVTVLDGDTAALTLVRPPSGELAGVVRENGRPLSRATVTLVEGTADQGTDGLTAELSQQLSERVAGMVGGGTQGKTDRDGAYTLSDVPVGTHRLRVSHRDRAMPALVEVTVREGENRLDVDLTTATISGRVLDPSGAAIARAEVSIARATPGAESSELMRVMNAAGSRFGFGVLGTKVRTDSDGIFELVGVLPDQELTVRATAKGHAPSVSPIVQVPQGGSRDGVDLILQPAGSVRVRAPSAPALGGGVKATPASTVDGGEPSFAFLRNGTALLEGLQAGQWTVTLSGFDDGAERSQTVEVVAGKTTEVEL
ncbi:MAG: carboxypeptidase-like regulatory domain-containing protein [Planctomycetota bacterium]